jgi:hypothetical protein
MPNGVAFPGLWILAIPAGMTVELNHAKLSHEKLYCNPDAVCGGFTLGDFRKRICPLK